MSDNNDIGEALYAASVLVFRPGEDPKIEVVGTDLKSWQSLVGGYVESHRIGNDLHLMCNEEGRLLNLPPNRHHPDFGLLLGTFFVTKDDGEGGTINLETDDIVKVLEEAKHHWPRHV